jgi:hypothetical protein
MPCCKHWTCASELPRLTIDRRYLKDAMSATSYSSRSGCLTEIPRLELFCERHVGDVMRKVVVVVVVVV